MKLIDSSGKVLGHLDAAGKFVPSDDPRAAGWDVAVPSIRARTLDDGTIVEEGVEVSSADEVYGLAFAEAAHERGWSFEEDA